MDKTQVKMFSEADQILHNMIHNIDEALKTLQGSNKLKAEQMSEKLEEAHWLIHELDYENNK